MVIREDVDDPYFASLLFAQNGIDIDQSTVKRVLRDQIETVVWLDALHEGLPVFFHEHGYSFDRQRRMAKIPGTDEPMILGEPLPPASAFPTDLEPSVDRNDAIAAWLESVEREPMLGINASNAGRQQVTLGFHNVNLGTSHPPDFRLVWRVQSPGGAPVAMVDAKLGSVLFFDSGIRSGGPVVSTPPEEQPQAVEFNPVGTWTSGRCSDRQYRRELQLSADNTFSAIDYVSPCPRGANCVWSGIVNRSGTWELFREHDIKLTETSSVVRQGVPLATDLHYDALSGQLLEATPGSVLNCTYERASNPVRH